MAPGLALHTSTDILGLGLQIADKPRILTLNEGRALSETLQPRLEQFLPPYRWRDLVWIAVCIGPGSFTSTRLGVMTARTLAQTLAIPLFGIDALIALAAAQDTSSPIAVRLDARRGDFYAALFERRGAEISILRPAGLVLAADWPAWRSNLPAGCLLVDGEQSTDPPIAALSELAHHRYEAGERPHWQQVEPLYLRPPPIHPAALS